MASFKVRSIGVLQLSISSSSEPIHNWSTDWNIVLLQSIARKSIPPTIASRWMFLWSMLLHDAYQYVTPNETELDYFPPGKAFATINDKTSWVETAIDWATKYLISEYIKDSIDNALIITQKHAHSNYYADIDDMIVWKERAKKYLQARDSDGWKTASTFIGTLPNAGRYIVADNPSAAQLQNLNDLPDPTKWTPLAFISGGTPTIKNYLTPEWGSIVGVISDTEKESIIAVADDLFPTADNWTKEIDDMLKACNSLTDYQKMVVEFWAGGPFTVTPPGIWNIVAGILAQCRQINLGTEVRLYTTLNMAMFEAGIIAWTLKKKHLQSRPIQEIRRRYTGNVTIWNNTSIPITSWMPYQEANFVTPPFPDFVSGHSTFSAAASRILYHVLGESNLNMNGKTVNTDLSILSALFKNKEIAPLIKDQVWISDGVGA